MNVTVCVSSVDQDMDEGVALDAAFKDKKWKILESVPFSYAKDFHDLNQEAVLNHAKNEVEDIIFQADWHRVKYIMVTSLEPARELSFEN